MWGTVENFSPTCRDLAAGRCINILSGEVRHGEVFIIFGGPQGHADRLATCGRLSIGLPAAPITPEGSPAPVPPPQTLFHVQRADCQSAAR
jgi:hypothetical protein